MDQPAGFRQRVVTALARLKQRLQRDLEKAHPELREIIVSSSRKKNCELGI